MTPRGRWFSSFLAVGLLLSACGSTDNEGSSSAPTAASSGSENTDGTDPEDEPTSSGNADADLDARVVYASCCAISDLDPHNAAGAGVVGWMLLYDRLTYPGTYEDPDAPGVSPMLAKSWEHSEDGLQLALTLRDDVTFNDGSPVNADAVKASLDRARESSVTGPQLASVESVDATGDYSVVLNLTQPDASLPGVLSSVAGAVMNPAVISDPEADLTLAPPPEAGSGPYVVSEFVPGDRAVYERADGEYWDPTAARAAVVEHVAEPDPNTRLNGLQAGDFDVVFLSSTSVLEGGQLAETDDFGNFRMANRSTSVLWMRYFDPAISDIRVRQAIAMAVDRAGIGEGALGGTCVPNEQLWPPGTELYDDAFETPYPYDLQKAQALLEEAGVDGLTIDVVVPGGATQETIGTALQASLAEIGVTMNVVPVPQSDTIPEFLSGRYAGSINTFTNAGQPDPALTVSNEFGNRTGLIGDPPDPAFTELEQAARQELDPAKRTELYQEISRFAVENVWAIPVCNAELSWAYASDVVGVELMPFKSQLPSPSYLGKVHG